MTLYSLIGDQRGQVLNVIFSDGTIETVDSSHANFKEILNELIGVDPSDVDEDNLRRLVDLLGTAAESLTSVSERVMVSGSRLLFDGEEVNSALSTHIVNLVREGDERGWKPLVAFLEKLATNPSKESQNSLYEWITRTNLTIAEDGDFVAYKGVKVGPDGESLSIHAGPAFVNNEPVNGYVPNPDGAVISMARSDVDANTGVGCSTGLHAGTWSYASGFAHGRVLEVRINPRDVVSVPNDCEYQKLRVSRYKVVSATDVAYSTSTVYDTDNDWDDDDYDDEDYESESGYSADSDEMWPHDPDGRIRAELEVEEDESPDEVCAQLVSEYGFALDDAIAEVWPDGR